MALKPDDPGVRCLMIELSLSEAIFGDMVEEGGMFTEGFVKRRKRVQLGC
jgi:hypothetical protein